VNNRHLTLSLAVALAIASPCASAMGLGQLQVKSGLYQPLVAEIPIISATSSELDQLDVRLASPDAFARVGLERPGELTANLQFSVGTNASGQPVIRITTPSRFTEPVLSFLIEASWGKGTVTREYTALIDPPYIAPAVIQPMITPSIAAAPAPPPAPVAAAPTPAPPVAETLPAEEPEAPEIPAAILEEPAPRPIAVAPAQPPPAPVPAPAPRPTRPPPKTVAATPPPPKPARAPAPEPTPPAPAAAPGQVGPVKPGQTLWSIADSVRPDPSVSMNQMMVALLRANPDAFAQDNINWLKQGSVLRVPGQEEINRLSAEDAAALVSQQAAAWRSPRQAVPQPAESSADQNIAPAPAAAPKPSAPRVAAATPRRSSSRLEIVPPAGNSRARGAQSGAAAGAGGTELRAELAQAREDLAARTAEVTELKSRVADLERQESDRQRLIEMQNSQLKELQDRLRQMEAEQAAAAASPTAPAASATVAAAAPATIAASEPAPAPAATPDTATTPAAAVVEAPADTSITPWYLNPYILVGALLLVLGGLVLAMRRRKTKPASGESNGPRLSDDEALRASIAKTRAASEKITPVPAAAPVVIAPVKPVTPVAPVTPVTPAAPVAPVAPIAAKPAKSTDLALDALEEAVRERPQDLEAHLSLLRLHHSRGNAKQYEIAAQAMRARVPSTMDPRWREAVIMGASLLPGDSLFSQAGWNSPRFGETEAPKPAAPAQPAAAPPPPAAAPPPPVAAPPKPVERAPEPPVKVFDKPVVEEQPSFIENAEALDEIDLDDHSAIFSDMGMAPDDVHRSEAQLMVEDEASATRIELAKAYLAIGDLDGARSMLEEVLAEGGPAAQGEAGRILKEIG
jgi:pilus assembly protein FimV